MAKIRIVRISKKAHRRLWVERKQRDTVFRYLFKQKKELLSLYNAVAGTHYTDEDELEVKTLEGAVFLARKNDLAFVFRTDLQLYEHQSTVNPNMPIRFLQYFSELLERDYVTSSIYGKKCLKLPAPTFITFYNGEDVQPERVEMLLSDHFEEIERTDPTTGIKTSHKPVNVELKVIQININPGFNEKLKEDCPSLKGYIEYWSKVSFYRDGMHLSLNDAVEKAVDDCIREGILVDFLRKNKAVVKKMSIYEFDQKGYEQIIREESKQEGIKEGGDLRDAQRIEDMLQRGKTVKEIVDFCGYSKDLVERIEERMHRYS